MRPASGRISPRHSLRMVLLPEPATPSTALVSPRFSSKETPSSTLRPSKPSTTSSKIIVLWTVSAGSSENGCGWNVAMGYSTKLQHKLREDDVHGQNENGRHHNRLGGRTTDSLGTAARAHTVVAPDCGNDKTEEERFNQTCQHVVIRQLLVRGVPVLVTVQAQHDQRIEPASNQTYQIRDDGKEEHHDHGGDHARGHQLFGGVGAQGAHGVNLLSHFHRAQFAGHSGGVTAGYHQAG